MFPVSHNYYKLKIIVEVFYFSEYEIRIGEIAAS